jgi:hypothetical protein
VVSFEKAAPPPGLELVAAEEQLSLGADVFVLLYGRRLHSYHTGEETAMLV